MAFTFQEIPSSRESTLNPPSITLNYRASGEVSDGVAGAHAYAATPAVIFDIFGNKLYRQDIKCSPAGHKLFYFTVPYAESPKETGNLSWSFSTTGGTVTVKAAKQHIASYPADPANPHMGLIGVNREGNVEGCEIVIPALKMTYNFKHPLGVITEAHARLLASYTGMVNNTAFRGFPAGEMLFLGASGGDGTDSEAAVTYEFAASQNITGLTIGALNGIAKKGWEYLWIEYTDAVAGNAQAVQPKRVNIERVYNTLDFASAFGWG